MTGASLVKRVLLYSSGALLAWQLETGVANAEQFDDYRRVVIAGRLFRDGLVEKLDPEKSESSEYQMQLKAILNFVSKGEQGYVGEYGGEQGRILFQQDMEQIPQQKIREV